MIQTLIGAQQTGTLPVTQDDGQQRVAELFFFKGNVAKAKVRHLSGDDAVFQLFQAPLEGEFSFTGRTVQEEDVQSDITMPAISLLMESVRLQDELPLLQGARPRPRAGLPPEGGELAWAEADTVELAASVWSRLRKGASLADLQKDVAALLVRDLPHAWSPCWTPGRSSSGLEPAGFADHLLQVPPGLAGLLQLRREPLDALALGQEQVVRELQPDADEHGDAERLPGELRGDRGVPFTPDLHDRVEHADAEAR